MTIRDVFEQLSSITQGTMRLLRETGFNPEEGLGDSVGHIPDEYEDGFLRHEAEKMLTGLSGICSELRYLRKPSHGEFPLEELPGGRYGYYDTDGMPHAFTCGQSLEAKVRDVHGTCRWIPSAIEHNGNNYYLVGFPELPLDGLTIRVRG